MCVGRSKNSLLWYLNEIIPKLLLLRHVRLNCFHQSLLRTRTVTVAYRRHIFYVKPSVAFCSDDDGDVVSSSFCVKSRGLEDEVRSNWITTGIVKSKLYGFPDSGSEVASLAPVSCRRSAVAL